VAHRALSIPAGEGGALLVRYAMCCGSEFRATVCIKCGMLKWVGLAELSAYLLVRERLLLGKCFMC
jgi:hypothetical protein